MILDERYTTFINNMYPPIPDYLLEIEKQALLDGVPIIRKETQNLLVTLINIEKPKKFLEVGTAVGFSALLMADAAEKSLGSFEFHITTIENYDKRIPIAKANFANNNRTDVIDLYEGNAADILKDLEGPYDFIFMDAAKGQYINFWPDVKRLIQKGGLVVTDNVLQDGDVIESRYAVTRRNRTIHKRMREYLFELCHDEDFSTSILPLGDGVAISSRR